MIILYVVAIKSNDESFANFTLAMDLNNEVSNPAAGASQKLC